jgi:hypothetical protein
LRILGLALFSYGGWVIIVAIIAYFVYKNKRKTKWVTEEFDTILLRIDVPKDNEKKELSAEQMFASLHGILRPAEDLKHGHMIQEHISFEIAARLNSIQFYVWCPRHLKDFVESQIYAQYPTVQIKEGADDYSRVEIGERSIYGTELKLTRDEVLPVKTFASFEVDPLAGITGVLAKLNEPGEEVWIQILARPVDDSWQDKGKRYIEDAKGGKKTSLHGNLGQILLELPSYILKNLIGGLISPPESSDKKKDSGKEQMSTGQQTVVKAVETKITKLGYGVKIRINYLGPDETTARHRMQAIVGGFKQFNTTNLNGFGASKYYNSIDFIEDYRSRLFYDAGSILNIEELASVYHLPHKTVETPNMVWTTSKTSEPPANLPVESLTDPHDVSLFGLTNFRGNHQKFGIKRKDRGRHMYLVGQTGAGKSGMLTLLTLSDIYQDQGFAIIDPHGDFATDVMKFIPEHRLKDVVYFSPADREFPMAFNPMEVNELTPKDHISSELVGVLKRMFGYSWGPRLEYILRYTILALLDHPGTTMLDITRMLVEKDFRKAVIADVKDPVVRNFWLTEFATWDQKFAAEAVAPVLNKVGAFVANPLIRNIVGQPKSAFDIRKIMDEGKILIVNLSKGLVGEDNAAILGALMVTKIQLAAMSRADISNLDDRRPFYLYVDEFQNFATESFGVILSEARKYSLCLTVANQYISQMDEVVRDAIFGNVGTMVAFRVGPGDSVVLGKYYEPVFEAADLTRLNNRHMFASMIIDGEKAIPFSATTLRIPEAETDLTPQIIEMSRQRYASNLEAVTADIEARTSSGQQQSNEKPAAGQPTGGRPGLSSGSVQIPNRQPRSEFLAALQNPDLPPAPAGEQRGRGNYDNRSPRRDNRGSRSQSSPQQQQRDDAVRQAIRAAQSNNNPDSNKN